MYLPPRPSPFSATYNMGVEGDKTDYRKWLEEIPARAGEMLPKLRAWCAMPTPSLNADGIGKFVSLLISEFAPWVDTSERLSLNPWETIDERGARIRKSSGPALRCFRRLEAPLRVFLGIHTDVVYADLPNGTVPVREENGRLYGAGAADAKGGIAALLLALQAFERSPFAAKMGFEILLNPDEELGSPGSLPLLGEAAGRNHLGLLFEPALPNGALVSARKGSGNFTAVLRGRGGHAGRDAESGRNSLHGLAEFIMALNAFAAKHPGITVNVGRIDGGGPVNRIPDLGIARFNVRVETGGQAKGVEKFLASQAAEWNAREGYALEFHGGFSSPPKPVEGRTKDLLEATIQCGQELGLALQASPSGGVCDGNKLAALGLPNLDTLGPVGGNLHGGDEWMQIASLAERASLTALLLMKLAAGAIALP